MAARLLDIVGFGIGGAGNVTLAANSLLASSDRIFTLVRSPDLEPFMKALERDHSDLLGCYKVGLSAADVYLSIVDSIVNDHTWERAVFLVEGNPQVYNTPVRRLRIEGERRGWRVRVHPAVSSLDLMLIDLDLYIEDSGLQILDAARMLIHRIPVSTRIGCLILQIAACTLRSFVSVRDQDRGTFEPLQKWLAQFYPLEHEFIILRSSINSEEPLKMIKTNLNSFLDYANQIDYDCSVYIPPIDSLP
jgi:uncharacterized protein YabN with tetrapyrrole methylase and pyrophosphatase domain